MADAEHIYSSPDIRVQTIEQAENFLQAKRVRRMIVLASYQQKEAEKLSKLKGVELEKFKKRAERVKSQIDKLVEFIDKLENAIINLNETHNTLTNIEQSEVQL